MNEITKNLYQGDVNDAIRVSRTKEVDAIVYVGQELPKELSHESKIPVIHFPLKDGKGSHELLVTMAILDIGFLTFEDKTLVACRAGISRSPTIVVGYLATYEEMSFDDAVAQIHKLSPSYQPEPNFLKTVKKVVKKWYRK